MDALRLTSGCSIRWAVVRFDSPLNQLQTTEPTCQGQTELFHKEEDEE